MAHLIKKYDRQQGIKQAWHGLTHVSPEITVDNNWLTEWDIMPVELIENQREVVINGETYYQGVKSGLSRLVCSDNKDIKIGQGYNPLTFTPISNVKFLELVRESISGTSHKVFSVGSVRNRGRVFLSIELVGMEKFKSAGRDFSAYLNFGNGHDKSSVLWCNSSNTATVCDNTFSINLVSIENKAIQTGSDDDLNIRQRHTKNAEIKLPEIAKLIDKAIGVQAEFQIEFEKLAHIQIAKADAQCLFAGFVSRKSDAIELSTRASNTVDHMVELFHSGKGNDGNDESDVMSAITDYYTHFSSGKGNDATKQFLSSEFGAGQLAKTEFWNGIRNPQTRSNWMVRGDKLLTV